MSISSRRKLRASRRNRRSAPSRSAASAAVSISSRAVAAPASGAAGADFSASNRSTWPCEMYSPRNRSSVSGSVARLRATAARTRASISSRRRSTWISDGSAPPPRPSPASGGVRVPGSADILLGAVDAANAQNAAGLLLLARANHFFLIRRHTGLVCRLAALEPPRGLRPTGSRRTHRLRGLGSSRAPTRSPASRRRRGRVLALTIGTREAESGLFQDRRAGGEGPPVLATAGCPADAGGRVAARPARTGHGDRPVLQGGGGRRIGG